MGMLYADDACIVPRSPQRLDKKMEVNVKVCRFFTLTNRVGEENRDRVHASTAYAADDGAS